MSGVKEANEGSVRENNRRASVCVSLTSQTQLCDFSYNQHSKLTFF